MAERGMELPPDYLGEEEEEEEEGEEEDEEYEEEEEEEEEEEDEDNADGDDMDQGSGTTLRQVLYGNRGNNVNSVTTTISSPEVVNLDTQVSEDADAVTVVGARESNSSNQEKDESGGVKLGGIKKGNNGGENKGELNKGEIDGLYCPICFEGWSSGGDHHCPQCKKKCGMKDIRLLYATQIVAVDGELQKTVQSLEAKCVMLEKKNADLCKKEAEWKKRETDLCKQVRCLRERQHNLQGLLDDMQQRVSGPSPSCLNCRGKSPLEPKCHMQGGLNKFIMQKEFQVDGARLFDIDPSSQIFVIARRLSGMGGVHVLTKVSLISDNEKQDIQLPENLKVVKDIRVSPHSRLVMLASLGKKLSVLSTESNNTVLTYDLPAAPWSCSWDVDSPHYVYAGLQNGTVVQFDTRHTMRHVQSLTGLTCNPVHTLHSLSSDSSLNSGIRSVLSASSLGLCRWNFGGSGERPYLIPESDKQGVCISLAYGRSSDDIVASYRPKIETSADMEITQATLATSGQMAQGSHVLYRRTDCTYQKLGATCANVSDIRLPKSTIIDGVYQNPVFASGDELTHELVLQELPSLMAIEHLTPKKPPIRDIKFTRILGSGLLSCLSEDSLHLFSTKIL